MNIPSAAEYIQVEATQTTSPVSESSAQAAGGSINFLLDSNTTNTAAIAALTSDITAISRLRLVSSSNMNSSPGSGTTILSTTSTQFAIVQFFAAASAVTVDAGGLTTYTFSPQAVNVTTGTGPISISTPVFIGPSSDIKAGGGLIQATALIFESATGP